MNSEISTDFGYPRMRVLRPVRFDLSSGSHQLQVAGGTGREFELQKSDTTCAFCSLGCTLTLGRKSGKIVYVSSPPESVNEGNLCVKGRMVGHTCIRKEVVQAVDPQGWRPASGGMGRGAGPLSPRNSRASRLLPGPPAWLPWFGTAH